MSESNRKFVKLFWSYITIIIIPILILGFLTIELLFGKLAEDTKKLNLDIIEQTANIVDDEITKIFNLFFQIEEDQKIQSIINERLYNYNIDKYTLYDATNELHMLKTPIPTLRIVGFYIKDDDLVVTDGSVFTIEEFYQANFNSKYYSYNDFKNQITQGVSKNKFLSLKNTSEEECVMFYKRMNVYGNKKNVTVFAIANNDVLISKSRLKNVKDTYEFAMTDLNGKVIMKSKGFNDDTKKGNQKISVRSRVTGAKYTYYNSRGAFVDNVYNLMFIFLTLILITIFVSVVLAFFNMQKIKRIFLGFFRENKELEETLSRQQEGEKERILVNILHNVGYRGITNTERIQSSGIEFSKKYFTVMSISSIQSYEQDNYSYIEIKAWDELNHLIKNKISELRINCEIIRTGNNLYSYILNFDTNCAVEEIRGKLSELMGNYNISVNIGIGEVIDNIERLHIPYEESISSLRFGIIKKPAEIVLYNEIQENEHNKIYYTNEKKNELMRCVILGMRDDTVSVINEIHRVNFEQRHISYEMQKRLIYMLSLTVYEIIDEIYKCDSEKHKYYSRLCRKLFSNDDIEESFSILRGLFQSLCGDSKNQSEESELKKQIVEYINKNYSVRTMSLDTLAKHLNISYYYLSRIFKEYIGTNFVSYITLIRLEKAKELLDMTDDSVDLIAVKTGFMSAKSFVRVFKKYYNMTPAKYRKM